MGGWEGGRVGRGQGGGCSTANSASKLSEIAGDANYGIEPHTQTACFVHKAKELSEQTRSIA